MDGDDDALLFADDEAGPVVEQSSASVWKLLVIDDEPAIHDVTRLTLGGLKVEGHPLAILSAYTAAAGRAVLQAHPDVAVVLLDVVMESDDAGLELVRWIRGELGNTRVRIVLRTGQPGHAPEQRVMFDYDINDYRDKTEVTAQRLTTTVIGALRSYRDLCTIEAHKSGLEQVLRATAVLFERQSIDRFIAAVLQQLSALVSPQESAMFFRGRELGLALAGTSPTVVAGTGRFAAHRGATGQPGGRRGGVAGRFTYAAHAPAGDCARVQPVRDLPRPGGVGGGVHGGARRARGVGPAADRAVLRKRDGGARQPSAAGA
jgi:CheY-like chemotaxis protein